MLKLVARAAMSLLGGAVLFGTAWWAVSDQRQQARIATLEAEKAELIRVIGRLQQQRRTATIYVADQRRDASGDVLETMVEFTPIRRDGAPGSIRKFTIPGDLCYVEALVIRFLDSYVEQGDKLRGHSVHLFRRAFGEHQRPSEGYPLDDPGRVPDGYGDDKDAGQFERRLWQRFWDYATDPKRAAEVGVRIAQGEAPFQRLERGQLWQLSLRADGGMEFSLLGAADAVANTSSRPPGQH